MWLSSTVTCWTGSAVRAASAASQRISYTQASAPRAWQAVSSTVAGGSPKRTVGWLRRPLAQSQWWTVRSKPSHACSRITARPGSTSGASSSDTVENLLPACVICR
jgi:hypothetical protein